MLPKTAGKLPKLAWIYDIDIEETLLLSHEGVAKRIEDAWASYRAAVALLMKYRLSQDACPVELTSMTTSRPAGMLLRLVAMWSVPSAAAAKLQRLGDEHLHSLVGDRGRTLLQEIMTMVFLRVAKSIDPLAERAKRPAKEKQDGRRDKGHARGYEDVPEVLQDVGEAGEARGAADQG